MTGRPKGKTFVVVHGAWVGAWSVSRLARRLRNLGHEVHAPTLSGLGERAVRDPAINLSTHINDVLHLIETHKLNAVTLVGMSYGGLVITGVAERIPGKIAALAYVDAFIPGDNQSFCDITHWTIPGDLVPFPEPQKAG